MDNHLIQFAQANLMYVVLAVTSGAMLAWNLFGNGASKGISPLEATLLMNREDALIVDVRENGEWSAGHIANARHIPLGQLDKRMAELEKFKARDLIVLCQSGNRSANACRRLSKSGFEKVHNLAGGISAWTDAGLPVTNK